MAHSKARKVRDKRAKEKGYDYAAGQRGGQFITFSTLTKVTPTKKELELRHQRKHKKRPFSVHRECDASFFRSWSLKLYFTSQSTIT